MKQHATTGLILLLLSGGAMATGLFPQAVDHDYTSLPDTATAIENALRNHSLSLAEATVLAEAETGAVAGSATYVDDDGASIIVVMTYGDGISRQVTIDASVGEVIRVEETPRLPGYAVSGECSVSTDGIRYWDVAPTVQKMPSAVDQLLRFQVGIWLTDGTELINSWGADVPLSGQTLQQFSRMLPGPGWAAAIADLGIGSQRKFLLDYQQAFGDRPASGPVPLGAMLICDVEVVGMVDYETLPAILPGESVADGVVGKETDSGLVYYVLREGTGGTPSGPTATVRVDYTGWLTDGTKFDSSVDRGQPAEFALNGVIPGWTEGVSSMRVGELRKLVIPWALAYGAQGSRGIPPKAVLVFDIELLAVVDE